MQRDLKTMVFSQDTGIEAWVSGPSALGCATPETDRLLLVLRPDGCWQNRSGAPTRPYTWHRDHTPRYVGIYGAAHSVAADRPPPGYVGFDRGGLLTDAIDQQPQSVLLLEIEAHPDLFNILLQVMDCGKATDHKGEIVDLHNGILIMTTKRRRIRPCQARDQFRQRRPRTR